MISIGGSFSIAIAWEKEEGERTPIKKQSSHSNNNVGHSQKTISFTYNGKGEAPRNVERVIIDSAVIGRRERY